MINRILCGAALMVLGAMPGSAVAQSDPSAANIRAHMTYLASDLLQGLEAGSPGYDPAMGSANPRTAALKS